MRSSGKRRCIFMMVALLSWAGCGTTPGSGSKAASKSSAEGTAAGSVAPLRVGVTPRYPPLIYKEAGVLTGFEVEMARALGQSIGRPVVFVELPWDTQIDALLSGRTDIIMSSMTITFARTARVAFSTSYAAAGQMALVRRADADKYLLGIPPRPEGKLGVLEGTTGEYFVRETFPNTPVRRFKSTKDAGSAVASGDVALFISDAPVIWWMASVNEDRNLTYLAMLLTNEDLGWAVRKSDPELLKQVNEFLAVARTDGRLKEAVRRWLPH